VSRFRQIGQRLFNVPLAITPQKAELITAVLGDRLGVIAFDGVEYTSSRHAPVMGVRTNANTEPEMRACQVVRGVSIIPVRGTLVARMGCLQPVSGMTGYDGIRLNLMSALADPKVRAIMFDIDSPGGEVAGCFDLVDTIYRSRGIKPMWAVLNDAAYSAAYAIASACGWITVPRTGGTGSVGVICMHVDQSKALEKAGIAVTLIQYGDRKADGSDLAPHSDAALAGIQANVDSMGRIFTATVARNRGLDSTNVRATEAATFMGADGVSAGFADAVMAPDQAFRSLLDQLDAQLGGGASDNENLMNRERPGAQTGRL
jgi:ClpP class serine protease